MPVNREMPSPRKPPVSRDCFLRCGLSRKDDNRRRKCGTKMLFLCGRSVCCKVLCQIGDWVGRDGETVRVKRYSRWIRRINAPAVIHKILSERAVFDFLGRCVSDELAHNRADNLQMRQFLRTYVGEQPLCYLIGHWIPLGKIAQRCPEFAVRSAVL